MLVSVAAMSSLVASEFSMAFSLSCERVRRKSIMYTYMCKHNREGRRKERKEIDITEQVCRGG